MKLPAKITTYEFADITPEALANSSGKPIGFKIYTKGMAGVIYRRENDGSLYIVRHKLQAIRPFLRARFICEPTDYPVGTYALMENGLLCVQYPKNHRSHVNMKPGPLPKNGIAMSDAQRARAYRERRKAAKKKAPKQEAKP